MEQLVARRAHNPEAVGSNPAPATKKSHPRQNVSGFLIPTYQRVFIGSVKNVGVEDTPRISEPLSFFEKTLFSSAPTGVSHR